VSDTERVTIGVLERVREGSSSGSTPLGCFSLAVSRPDKPFQHEPNHGELHQTFATSRQILIIFAHASIATYPCQCSLDNPVTLPPEVVCCL